MEKTKVIKFDKITDGNVELHENFFPIDLANKYFITLKEKVEWKQETMMMYGKRLNFARLTSWYGEEGNSYSFSGITLEPNNWNEIPYLIDIKKEIEFETGTIFNSVLLNLYRGEKDSISWHSDNEKEFGENPVIASVSLGCTRTFRLRRYKDHSDIHSIRLTHGSLIIMKYETQQHWQHMVPKEKIKEDLDLFSSPIANGLERINLTFRTVI